MRAPAVRRGRKYRQLSGVGRRIARYRARRRRGPRFHLPDHRRWRRELAFRGLRPLPTGAGQAARLLDWARSRPGRADGRSTRLWVAHALARQHRHHPEEETIAAGHQQLADAVDRLGGPRLSRQTVQRVVQEMIDDAVVFLVARGCSARVTGDRNHVSVYVVVEPDALEDADQQVVDELRERLVGHLPVGDVHRVEGWGGVKSLPRTRGDFSPERAGPQRREQPERYAPRTDLERAAAIGWLLADLGWRLTGEQRGRLSWILRPWFVAGWSARAVRAALDRRPDGHPHRGPLPGRRQSDRRAPILIIDLIAVVGGRLRTWHIGGQPGPAPIAAERPRRGRPPVVQAPPAAAAAAAPLADDVRERMRRAIRAGLQRRADGDEAFRAGRRVGR